MALFKSFFLFCLFFLLKRIYGIKVAETMDEKREIFKFRYQIYRNELLYQFYDETVKDEMIYSEYDFLEDTLLLYSGDINNITGTIRMTVWKKKDLPEDVKIRYSIKDEIIKNINGIGEVRLFLIKKTFRNKLLGVFFVFACYFFAYKKNMLAQAIFCYAAPGLIHYYDKVGFFPFTEQLNQEFGILRIPLVTLPFHIRADKDVPFTYVISKFYSYLYKRKSNIKNEFIQTVVENKNLNIPKLNLFYSTANLIQYLDNIHDDQIRHEYDFILSLKNQFMVLTLPDQYFLIKNSIVDFDLYLLIQGELGVFIHDKRIATILPGQIIGEIAFFDVSHRRHADVRSIGQSKVLFIPKSFIISLEKHHRESAVKLLHIICNQLAKKLDMTNNLLEKIIDSPSGLVDKNLDK